MAFYLGMLAGAMIGLLTSAFILSRTMVPVEDIEYLRMSMDMKNDELSEKMARIRELEIELEKANKKVVSAYWAGR